MVPFTTRALKDLFLLLVAHTARTRNY